MSDHLDGPRALGDPASDLTDLYVFHSPERVGQLVLIADVFPFAGESALFSDAVNYSIALRPVRIAGLAERAAFRPQDPETRFRFQFEAPAPGRGEQRAAQRGVCRLPGGGELPLVVGEERGAWSADSAVRVFAGLRSDPFFMGWWPGRELVRAPNLLEGDNVLSLVVEFDMARVLRGGHTLFGAIAETAPREPHPPVGTPPRFDWVGRPEQSNYRLSGLPDAPDLRDLWNQQEPFACGESVLPLFRERMLRSLQLWDSRDGSSEWDAQALAASASVFLDDFLLFDVTRPIRDDTHLEIEKSTLEGRAYASGGGRTLDANAIDILVTWLVNRDRGAFMKSAAQATQPGGTSFPYVRPPNRALLRASASAELAASAAQVWAVVGEFGEPWMGPLAALRTRGTGIGQLRELETLEGRVIVERLTQLDAQQLRLGYELVSGMPAAHWEGVLEVQPRGSGCRVNWTIEYRAQGAGTGTVRGLAVWLQSAGLASLRARFAAAP